MYQLPWEHPDVRRVIEAFDCIVMEIEKVQEPTRRVVWEDWSTGQTHHHSMTSKQYNELYEQLERYDIGKIVSSEWD